MSLAPSFSKQLSSNIWGQFGESLCAGDDDISKIESFLLSQLNDDPALSNVEKSLKLLENGTDQISISTIADTVGLNLRTFQRHFLKHMGCSPVEYRRIYRFRSSLNNKLNGSQIKNLTDITHEEGYYN